MQQMQATEDGCEEDVGKKKWMCEYCTYSNWPSSSKCTMCRGNKPVSGTENIFSAVNNSNNQRDIYKLSGGQREASYPPSPPLSLPDTDHTGKWVCSACTYYNYPRAGVCTICRTPRPRPRKVSPGSSSRHSPTSPHTLPALVSSPVLANNNRANAMRSLADQLSPLHISVSNNNLQISQPSPETSKAQSPRIHCDAAQAKWNCSECTYENYPKSLTCVLCGTKRGRSSPDLASGLQASVPSDRRHESPSPEGAHCQYSAIASCSSRSHDEGAGAPAIEEQSGVKNLNKEKRVKQLRRRMRDIDWVWLSACMGVVEGDSNPVEAYLNSGGDPTRKLSPAEAQLLGRPGVYDAGHTLVHLAVKLGREDLLATLLSQMETASTPTVKRVPSYVASDLAASIRRQIAVSMRQRKSGLPISYLSDSATYTLPPEIGDLPRGVQEQMYSELLDKEAQQELEQEMVINWSQEITGRLNSKLSALWNRSAGDCLLDAALQASWGVFDRDNTLRQAISDSLVEAGHVFYPRWKEWEQIQALELDFTLAESQWSEEWAGLLSLASQPGESLEQLHVFCLAHVLRRPIIVYGVKYVKSWRGENLGLAKFEGVYLPLVWDSSFCYRSPLVLGYTRGHFCALVPPEPVTACGGAGGGAELPPSDSQDTAKSAFLPLMTKDRKILPVHFLNKSELGREEEIMRDWLDVLVTESGLLVAQQTIERPPLMVAQMTEEWLNYYRKIAQSNTVPGPNRGNTRTGSNLISNRESSEESDE